MSLPKCYHGGEYVRTSTPQLVKGVVPRGSVIWLLGQWGKGKSFVALDLAGHVANGISWHGRKVRRGKVLYIVGEGNAGMRKRQEAWAKEMRLDTGVAFMDGPVNLIDAGQIEELAELIAAERYDLAFIDTQHACSGGVDENAANDAALILAAVRELQAVRPELTIVLVHHLGADVVKVGRGSTAYPAAMDVVLQVNAEDPHTLMTLTARKVKDIDWLGDISLRLVQVILGEDEDGDPVSSCIVAEAQAEWHDGPSLTALLAVGVEGQTVKKLAGLMGITKQAVQKQLEALAGKGLARCEPRRGNQGDLWYSAGGE
jgi:putative DNA primase/helicase